jgi:hypothetical protein
VNGVAAADLRALPTTKLTLDLRSVLQQLPSAAMADVERHAIPCWDDEDGMARSPSQPVSQSPSTSFAALTSSRTQS